jgi:thiamine biosynthesis lipoprotein
LRQTPKQNEAITRRDVLRILAVAGVGGAAWKLGLFGRGRGPVSRTRTLMGTEVNLTVLGDDPELAARAAESTLQHMADLESVLSRYQAASQVSQLNRTGRIDNPSDALLDVLRLAEKVAGLGDSGFDITVQPALDLYARTRQSGGKAPAPESIEQALDLIDHRAVRVTDSAVTLDGAGMAITLDGIGKGYIVDRGVATLRDQGFVNVFVEAGGDLVAAGDKGPGRPWTVGIRSPRGLALQARFDATNRAVATSGDYMQSYSPDFAQHHIIDPRTGTSAPELASSTVIASDAATADALATLCMVLGSGRARALLEDLPGCEGYFVSKTLEVSRTSGFVISS